MILTTRSQKRLSHRGACNDGYRTEKILFTIFIVDRVGDDLKSDDLNSFCFHKNLQSLQNGIASVEFLLECVEKTQLFARYRNKRKLSSILNQILCFTLNEMKWRRALVRN